jgi:hypothetical protein
MKKNCMDVSTKFYLERKPTVDAQADPGSQIKIFWGLVSPLFEAKILTIFKHKPIGTL